ncbi:uncharacterized protein EDB91DRAFT_1306144 [Suillus paluster]|uniref:uncharacterized protein n=1 Tax=Suillus paluster TaxID=48578 RepID=UPI001B87B63D|nr:uncharacterized protein EDB91DRAFT_1306144 [Suillus paluster]KAG1731361.1 hypothetical protein EDB91DRAFT_1306144 [Suillus paluster]
MTHPELEEDFNKAEEERREKDKADVEKQAKKKTEDEVHHAQIEHDIKSKTFDALSTLRRKDDFITLAGTLKILRDGTVEELRTRIKEFLADNPRFAALFQTGKTCSKNSATASSTGQASSSTSKSQVNGVATSSNTSGNHFFTAPTHSFNSAYPPHFTNQPYFPQFYANPALYAPSYSTTQHNFNPSGSPIASSSNLDRQPQHPHNVHGLPTHPPQFYNYSTNHSHPRT